MSDEKDVAPQAMFGEVVNRTRGRWVKSLAAGIFVVLVVAFVAFH